MNLDHNLKTETQDHYICILMNVHQVLVVSQRRYLCANLIKCECLWYLSEHEMELLGCTCSQ